MKMLKRALIVAAAAVVVLWSLGGPAQAQLAAPGTGLKGSYHDFVCGPYTTCDGGHTDTTITPNSPWTNTTVGLCTYCHTPHHAQTTELLWNHQLSSSTYQWDVPSTTAGTTYPTFTDQTYGGPTAKCLSCHDGTVSPGDYLEYGPTGPGTNTQPAGTISQYALTSTTTAGLMTGMHPVAMPYPYQNQANSYNGVTTGSAIQLDQWQPTPIAPVRLYTDINDNGQDIVAGATAGKSGIECSSCHDVHNDLSVDYDLLLGMDSGTDTNYICLKCHIK